jgi:hypothetical protein
MSKKCPVNPRPEPVSKFNTLMFSLMNRVKIGKPDPNVDRVIDLMKTGKRIDHEIIITMFGPYLIKYAKNIRENTCIDIDIKVLRKEIEKEMEKDNDAEAKSNKELAINMLNTIVSYIHELKKIADEGSTSTDPAKTTIKDINETFQSLLDTYIDFCVHCQKGCHK